MLINIFRRAALCQLKLVWLCQAQQAEHLLQKDTNRDEDNIGHRRTEPSTKMKYASLRNTIAYRPPWDSHHGNPVRSLSTTKWDLLKMVKKPSLCPASSPVPPPCWNHRREDTSCCLHKVWDTAQQPSRQCFAEGPAPPLLQSIWGRCQRTHM